MPRIPISLAASTITLLAAARVAWAAPPPEPEPSFERAPPPARDASEAPAWDWRHPGPHPNDGPAGWGLHTGDTAGDGRNLIFLEAGWPDVSVGFLHGVARHLDIGFRASVVYGVDFTRTVSPGFELRVPFRLGIVQARYFSLMAHADPGIKIDYLNPVAFYGPEFPFGFEAGFHPTEKITVGLGAEAPFSVRTSPDRTYFTPLLGGLSFEAHFTPHFGVSYVGRAGVVHGFGTGGSATGFGLIQQAAVIGRF